MLLLCSLASAQVGCGPSSGEAGGAQVDVPDGAGELTADAAVPIDDAGDVPPIALDGGQGEDAAIGDETDAGDPQADAAPSGIGCDGAIPLTGASGSAEVVYDAEASSAFAGSCGGDGPERTFAFTLPERSLYSFELAGGAVDGVLFLRRDCGDADSEIDCHDGLNSDQLRGELEAGTYYLFADAYAPVAQGLSALTWEIAPHPCLDVQCGAGARCELSEKGMPQCACEEDYVYDGSRCVADPCAHDPCAEEQGTACVYAVEALPDHACVPRAWTLLVYMSADNDLWGSARTNLEEMRLASLRATSQSTLTLVVLLDGPRSTDTQLLRIRRGDIELLDPFETFLAGRSELDMADATTLRDFGVWAIGAYPAERYGLILWDHGTGWRHLRWLAADAGLMAGLGEVMWGADEWRTAAGISARSAAAESALCPDRAECVPSAPVQAGWLPAIGGIAARGFSNDFTDNPQDLSKEISIASGEYARALAAMLETSGQKFDLIAFDACQMGLYEVAHASAPYADYFVASEDRIPASGFPYLEILTSLYEDDGLSTLDWGRAMVDAYVARSPAHGALSVTDLSTLAALDRALDALAAALLADCTAHACLQAIAEHRAQSLGFYAPAHRDLGDFAQRLSASTALSTEIRAAAAALADQIGRSVPHVAAQASHALATGLAIYFPAAGAGVDADYLLESALWNQASRWSTFLSSFARIEAGALPSEPTSE